MRRRLLLMLPLATGLAFGQGSQFITVASNSNGSPIKNPVVRVCGHPAVGQPCTNTATIYTDQTLGTTAANPATGDNYGNVTLYAPSGYYDLQYYLATGKFLSQQTVLFPAPSGGGGGGSGTVTSVSSGNFSPLFNVSITNPTITPAFSFSAINQTANQVYAGPASGVAAAPGFRALVSADIPANAANTTGNAATATALAATPTQCGANNFATGVAASGNANCSQPAYSGISGTPTLEYQTVQNGSGVDQTQRGKVEFTGTAVSSVTDDAANNRTVVTLTASAGSGITLQTGGVNNASQTALNFQNGTATNGITIQPSNPAGGNEQMAISGTLTVPGGGTGLATLAAHQLYVGNGTSVPTAIAAGTNGQVLESAGAGADPAFQDPIVSGPDAVAAAPTKNPVQVGCLFLTTPATLTNNQVGALQCDNTQNLLVKVINALTVSGTVTANLGTLNGAATAAKQPALGTAGTASTDVITVQGIASMTALKVDGSAVTQPVSAASLPLPTGAATSANQTATEPRNIAQIGGTAVVADPCQSTAKLYVSINQTANTKLVTGTAAKKIYICSIHVVTAAANNVALVEGTGTTCGTGTAGVSGFGGATAATGWNFAANGGIAYGNGSSALGAEGTAADDLCLYNSAAVQTSGGISYVVQ